MSFFMKQTLFRMTLKKDRFYWATAELTTAKKMKFSIKDFFSKCDQIRSFLRMYKLFVHPVDVQTI